MNKFFVVGFMFLSLVGCATNGDVERVQNQITNIAVTQKILKDNVITLNSRVLELEKTTGRLNSLVETLNEDVSVMNTKLDRVFTKSIMK